MDRSLPSSFQHQDSCLRPQHSKPATLFIFVDGIGIGPCEAERNPFAAIQPRIFTGYADRHPQPIAHNGVSAVTDACLGVPGLPQSATGQAALLTGVNAAAHIGRHLNGHPNQKLHDLLARESLFVQLKTRGFSTAFANCYQPRFFEQMPRRVSVTTSACLSAGVRLNTLDDLRAGRAVYQDFTLAWLRARGVDIDLLEPERAGANLAAISRDNDFTLYEHFLTDLAGHSRDLELSLKVARNLERFLTGVLEHMDLEHQTVVLSSDHGNFEDLSTRSHTKNPVYTICWGRGKEEFASRVHSITDVTPALVDHMAGRKRDDTLL